MSKSRRKQVARRGPPTSSGGLARERIIALDRLLKDDAIGGRLDHDPDFRDRILAHGFNALHELVVMAHDPQYPPSVRALAQFKASDHLLQPLKAIDASAEVGPVSVQVLVAPWAAAGKPAPALTAPDETIVEPDVPRNNSSPPTPTLSDRERLREQVRAQRETVVIEAPVSPSEPAHVIGRVSQGRPYELSDDEKQRLTERLQRGPQ
jgi:hypothetical protein